MGMLLAERLGWNLEHLEEKGRRNHLRTTLDLLFKRTPRVRLPRCLQPDATVPLLLMGPVWMGQIAFPLRACLQLLSQNPRPYAVLCLSGGGQGPDSNPKLLSEIEKRVGRPPLVVLNPHVADLLPQTTKPSPESIMDTPLSREHYERVAEQVLPALHRLFPAAS